MNIVNMKYTRSEDIFGFLLCQFTQLYSLLVSLENLKTAPSTFRQLPIKQAKQAQYFQCFDFL